MDSYGNETNPVGRPTLYSEELVGKFLWYIASGQSLRSACKMPGMPSHTTILRWFNYNEGFRSQYARATEFRADMRFEKIDEIVRDMMLGLISPRAARVMIDALKWQMSKENPKRYGN